MAYTECKVWKRNTFSGSEVSQGLFSLMVTWIGSISQSLSLCFRGSSLKLNTYTQWSVIRQKPGTGLVLGWFQGELSMTPGSGYPVNRCPPSEAGVNQLPRVLEHLLPFVYGIKDFLPGAQLQVDILKVLVRAKHQSF